MHLYVRASIRATMSLRAAAASPAPLTLWSRRGNGIFTIKIALWLVGNFKRLLQPALCSSGMENPELFRYTHDFIIGNSCNRFIASRQSPLNNWREIRALDT